MQLLLVNEQLVWDHIHNIACALSYVKYFAESSWYISDWVIISVVVVLTEGITSSCESFLEGIFTENFAALMVKHFHIPALCKCMLWQTRNVCASVHLKKTLTTAISSIVNRSGT